MLHYDCCIETDPFEIEEIIRSSWEEAALVRRDLDVGQVDQVLELDKVRIGATWCWNESLHWPPLSSLKYCKVRLGRLNSTKLSLILTQKN